MSTCCSTTICHKEAFNGIYNKQRSQQKSTIKAPRNSPKTSPKLTKTSKRYDKHYFGILDVKFGKVPHKLQCFYINF